MNIEIRRLTPALAQDYVRFFDATPHDDDVDENKCYCVCWCNDDSQGKDFSTRELRRDWATKYVEGGHIQGYLAYSGSEIVGWCNANTKSDCLKCVSWRRNMGSVPTEASGAKIKSIFCFVIAPEWKRRGIAKMLMERVCQDALRDGFDAVEAYPNQEFSSDALAFMGPLDMYRAGGFAVHGEADHRLIMRKALNGGV